MPDTEFFTQLLAQFGYAAIAAGTFFKAFTVVLVAGALAHQGYLWMPMVIFSAWIGTVAGDEVKFCIGWRWGPAALAHLPGQGKMAARLDRLHALIRRYDIGFILGFRFVYGMRTITPLLLGLEHVSPWRFFVVNTAGALLWNGGTAYIGYGLGSLLARYWEAALAHSAIPGAGAVLFGLPLVAGAVWWYRRQRKTRLQNGPFPKSSNKSRHE